MVRGLTLKAILLSQMDLGGKLTSCGTVSFGPESGQRGVR